MRFIFVPGVGGWDVPNHGSGVCLTSSNGFRLLKAIAQEGGQEEQEKGGKTWWGTHIIIISSPEKCINPSE